MGRSIWKRNAGMVRKKNGGLPGKKKAGGRLRGGGHEGSKKKVAQGRKKRRLEEIENVSCHRRSRYLRKILKKAAQ